nr:hypothetical protein [Caloranaerobacter azorensis]
MYGPNHHGWIEVVVGPMYSGKSEELIRRLRRAQIARQKIQVFKPSIDDRYSFDEVVSHNGEKIKAIPVKILTRYINYYGMIRKLWALMKCSSLMMELWIYVDV